MKKSWIRFRLWFQRSLTTNRLGYVMIGCISFGILCSILLFVKVCNCGIHSLYYFLNFNFPEHPTERSLWRYLIVGIIGMVVVSGLFMMLVTSGIQRWVERIRGGQKVFKWIGNHYVMIGYNHQSINIINSLPIDKEHRLIILTEKNPVQIRAELQSALEDEAKEKNIVLYAGSRDRIGKLNLKSAKECYLLIEGSEWDSQYTRSLSVLREVARHAAGRADRLKTNMLIENIEAFNLFGQLDMPDFEGLDALDIHPFNLYDNWARLLWSYNWKKDADGSDFYKPLDFEPIENTDKHVHLVIVGFNSMGRALWQEAVRIAHYPNFVEPTTDGYPGKNRTVITVVDPKADETERLIRIQYPNLNQIADIDFDFRKARIEDEAVRKDLVMWAADENTMLTVAICLADPDLALSLAMSLPESLFYTYNRLELEPEDLKKPNGKQKVTRNPSGTQVLVRQSVKKPIHELLSANDNYNYCRYYNMRFFGDYAEAYNNELLDDFMAICVNGIYNGHGAGGLKLNASFYDPDTAQLDALDIEKHYGFWEAIWHGKKEVVDENDKRVLTTPEQSKLSTRYQIDHYRSTLAIQARDHSDEQLERLAQTEHLRWIAERTLAGWRQKTEAEKRVNDLKIHTDIMPYKDLDPTERTKDRNVVLFAQKLEQAKKEHDSKNKEHDSKKNKHHE